MKTINLFSSYALILFAGLSLSLNSCKKKDPPPPVVYAPDDVYIAGAYTEAGIAYPAYWKNGEKVELIGLSDLKEAGYIEAITVNGPDVYAVGQLYANAGQIILWKNGKIIKVTLDGEKFAQAKGISVSGTGDVYIVGSQKGANYFVPTYWKISGSDPVKSKPLTTESAEHVYGRGIAILNSNIYITGGTASFKIMLWKDDGTMVTTSELNNDNSLTGYSSGYGIAVSNDNIYIGGVENNTVKYWRNNKNDHVDLGVMSKTRTDLGCIALDASNNVYMAGYDFSGPSKKAIYWKQGSAPVTLTTPATTTDEYASAIAVARNNVYVTGFFNATPTTSRSILWMNGKKVPGFEGSKDIYATALFVVKK